MALVQWPANGALVVHGSSHDPPEATVSADVKLNVFLNRLLRACAGSGGVPLKDLKKVLKVHPEVYAAFAAAKNNTNTALCDALRRLGYELDDKCSTTS